MSSLPMLKLRFVSKVTFAGMSTHSHNEFITTNIPDVQSDTVKY